MPLLLARLSWPSFTGHLPNTRPTFPRWRLSVVAVLSLNVQQAVPEGTDPGPPCECAVSEFTYDALYCVSVEALRAHPCRF
jgi:hypothetical protein